MDQDKKICRLCLQIIGKDVPYSELRNNNVVLQHLNLVSFNTVKNLELVEDSRICNSCNNKVKELAKFKEAIIGNEFKIQCNQKTDVNIFLQTLSQDVDNLCRLCLKTSGRSRRNWHDIEKLISQCNIHMNVNISIPDKICIDCETSLQDMGEFMCICTENENRILTFYSERGKLTSKDLFKLFLAKGNTLEKGNNNNMLTEEAEGGSSKNEEQGTLEEQSSQILEVKSNDKETEEESFDVTKTPNTYKGKKTRPKKLKTFAEMPSTSRMDPSTNRPTDRKHILEEMSAQLRQMHVSIDTNPLTDINDITLLVDSEGMVQEEATSEYNATQELIDVLEGRLNDSATQELLDVLEGRSEDDAGRDIVVSVEIEPKKGKEGALKTKPLIDKSKSPIKKSLTNDDNKQVKVVSIQNTKELKKSGFKPMKVSTGSSKTTAEKRTDLKEKTIVKSFQERRYKKIGKNEEAETVENSTATKSNSKTFLVGSTTDSNNAETTKKASKKPQTSNDGSINAPTTEGNSKKPDDEATDNGNQLETVKATKKTKLLAQERKQNVADETSPPKKRPRRAPQKKSSAAATESESKEPAGDKPSSAPIKKVTTSDEELMEEDMQKKFENRPVSVTIIKGKKRTNKAQLEKTWQELTGKPRAGSSMVKELKHDEMQGGVEIKVVQRKRGRPALSEGERKMRRIKKEVIWMHCNKCSFKTYAHNSFIQHQLIHNIMSPYTTLHCNRCRFTSTNPELMVQHKASHDDTPNLNYKCVFCDELFRRKISCMYHVLRHDNQDVASQFYCLVYNVATEEECFECFQCNYQNTEESPMPDHVIDHTIEKPKNRIVAKFRCDREQCPYRSKSRDMLKRHKAMHDAQDEKKAKKKKPKAVKKEPGTATIKEEPEIVPIVNKVQNYEELPMLNCDLCHYATRNKRSLANHKGLKHNRPILPAVAGAAAAAQAEEEGRPIYYCNECSYSTYRKLNMPRHVLVHRTKENLEFYECPHCLFETKHRRSYTRHLVAVHGVVE